MGSSKSKAIKNALITLLQGLKLDGETAFVDVKGHPRGEFDGYPSARVLPGDQSTDKSAFGQNDRTVRLTVRTHLTAQDDGSEFDYMYDLTDLIIDALDSADYADALNLVDDGINAHILNTTRGDWYEADSQAGPLLICDIDVEVEYSQNN